MLIRQDLNRHLGRGLSWAKTGWATDFRWANDCFHGRDVLQAGLRDPDPRVRRIAAQLLRSPARLRPLVPDPRPANGPQGQRGA
jgi:hypothetical protein